MIASWRVILSPYVKNELDIDTNTIKDGSKIIPFKTDSTEPDDNCGYYPGRQKFFMSEKSPRNEKSNSLSIVQERF